ncbi:MAG TPA: DUF5677 domain-containing protein [Cyclobacteriaceae bacterium]|nr:DUF5677 domain-containing protein [Cyclobacteriaceae bacterium]
MARVRQTRTAWQKVFDPHPNLIQSFSWIDRLPELLHISMALTDNDYQIVKRDFYIIADFVNQKCTLDRPFHFNLSHTVKLIRIEPSILETINETCFRETFEQLLMAYGTLFDLTKHIKKVKPQIRRLLKGYKQILDGRGDTSILCKYMMVQYDHFGRADPFNMFAMNTPEIILDNVSRVMSIFPPSVGSSDNLDLVFCNEVWMHNYYYFPQMIRTQDGRKEEEQYSEVKMDNLSKEFTGLYKRFKSLNLWAMYPPFIAEINMGLAARISDLALDAVQFVKDHRGEVAELVFRTVLENFIVGSWLLKKRSVELHSRFREFSTGRDRFFGEKLMHQAPDDDFKKGAQKIVDDAIKDSGLREIDVATERGDIFDIRLDQMAEEVWGKDNKYYFLYKRTSEVTHGHWRIIAKYHLVRSENPMHNGLYFYDEDPKKFAGLIPAFTCLGVATTFLKTILSDLESGGFDTVASLNSQVNALEDKIYEQWIQYFNKYIEPNESPDPSSSIFVKHPKEIEQSILDQIVNLVGKGGEVPKTGLIKKITESYLIAFKIVEEQVVSTATIKNPAGSYRSKVFNAANFKQPINNMRELGYIVTHPNHTGRKYCQVVVKSLLEKGKEPLYATSRNESMIHILEKLGFTVSGGVYKKDLRLLVKFKAQRD